MPRLRIIGTLCCSADTLAVEILPWCRYLTFVQRARGLLVKLISGGDPLSLGTILDELAALGGVVDPSGGEKLAIIQQ